jgi:ATP dependent DNA ligase-like protein
VVLDNTGSSQFNELLFHRVEPYFYAFDVLWCEGKDLRLDALHEHKRKLRSLLTVKDRLLFCDHLEDPGKELFTNVCELDSEGVVAKRKNRPARRPRMPLGEDKKSDLYAGTRQRRTICNSGEEGSATGLGKMLVGMRGSNF